MSDLSQESLLREIDEDIRRERYAKLWKSYGAYVIAAVVALVLVVAGYRIWKQRSLAQAEEAATRYNTAIAQAQTDPQAAGDALEAIVRDGPRGYAMLAAFEQAALLAKGGDVQAARARYQELQQTAVDQLYSDLAVLLDALVALEKEDLPLDADAIRARLQPLTASTNPWRFTARELTAVIDWRSGRTTEARSQLTGLAEDPQTPADTRERAQHLLSQIGAS